MRLEPIKSLFLNPQYIPQEFSKLFVLVIFLAQIPQKP